MREIFNFSFVLVLVGCDTIPIRHETNMCLKHTWIIGKYKVTKIENLDVYLKNLSGGNDRVISKLDHGWKEIPCP